MGRIVYRDDIAYWITKGPNECQNNDGPFDESRQCNETKFKKNTKVTRVVRFCSEPDFPISKLSTCLGPRDEGGLQNLSRIKKITSFKSHVHCAELHNYLKLSTKMLVDAELLDGSKSMTAMLRRSASVLVINFELRPCHLSSNG